MSLSTITQSGVGSSRICLPDYLYNPVAFGLRTVVTGTATYTIQCTLDDVIASGFDPATARWEPVAGALTNATTSLFSGFSGAVRGFRITISAGTGSVVAKIIQLGVG